MPDGAHTAWPPGRVEAGWVLASAHQWKDVSASYDDSRCIAEKGCAGTPFPLPPCAAEPSAVDASAVFRCGRAWDGAIITVRGRAGLHLDFESQVAAPCGLTDGVVALDEGVGPAWPPRPIMERIGEDTRLATSFRYRPLTDVEGASCDADRSGACCALAVPIGGIIMIRGKLQFSSESTPGYESARVLDAALCAVR